MAERIYLNEEWGFTKLYSDELLDADLDMAKLETVRIPHTVAELPYHYFDETEYQMLSGYVRKIKALKKWSGKKVLLTFDGVGHVSKVYLNGELVGEHNCGYTAFTIDLSDKLNYGKDNLLTVSVDSRESVNVPPFGFVIDYMTYGGIYRDVYLEIAEPTYIKDVFVYSEFQDVDLKDKRNPISTKIQSQVEVAGIEEGMTASVKMLMRKVGASDFELLWEKDCVSSSDITLKQMVEQKVHVWDIKSPTRYEILTQVYIDDKCKDEKLITVGFRKADFRTDGFYLNGRKVKIRGLNRHQCYPYVGYAMPESMQKMDADILKNELGVNAVRTSHYPQSHDFISRCDEIGLMVFTEMPGWQHIGNAEWKDQAVINVKDMVCQYRNHPSIILWGVRINESQDDDEFYIRTNAEAHKWDPSRKTGGVRNLKQSNLLEDVYTYNDFIHDGKKPGCDPKKKVTSDMSKPYFISEYNGHMYPTKAYDWEEHRSEHTLRHARVLDAVGREKDICGSFGWCMFDYNTHKDFGSGDRICYHGVLDMFRNSKMAAAVYACYGKNPVLEITSSMDIGEHPGCNRGNIYIVTNADTVKMYKNGKLIKEYAASESEFKGMKYGPILIDDFIGDALKEDPSVTPEQEKILKKAFNTVARTGVSNIPPSVYLQALDVVVLHGLKAADGIDLYTKHIGDWGGTSTEYRFEAIKDGKVVKTVTKKPMQKMHIDAVADHVDLREGKSYDVAAIRLRMLDEYDNVLPFCNDPLLLSTEGPIELIGPKMVSLQGGMSGTYIKTTAQKGKAKLTISGMQCEPVAIEFVID